MNMNYKQIIYHLINLSTIKKVAYQNTIADMDEATVIKTFSF